MKRLLVLAVAGLLTVGLTGCSSKGHKGSGSDDMRAHTSGMGSEEGFEGAVWSGTDTELMEEARRTYYFGFDKFDLSMRDMSVVKAHARYLAAHTDAHVRIEGHTDERGSREYNVALGERRANAVKSVLSSEGVSEGQMSVVSYGAEKPADMGHMEDAYQLNRRAIIVYEGN